MTIDRTFSSTESSSPSPDAFELFGIDLEGEFAPYLLTCTDRGAAEKIAFDSNPQKRKYGALPHFLPAAAAQAYFAEEAPYFLHHYSPNAPGTHPSQNVHYAEGIVLFYEKFGTHLAEFTETVLAHYPLLPTQSKGLELSLFGLSGSGKTTAMQAIAELYGPKVILMDSDTVRYNFFAKMISDVEQAAGASFTDIRNNLIHTRLSGALYLCLAIVCKELKRRGYLVVTASTMPKQEADEIIYLSHPDGIDPRRIPEERRREVAATLFARTQARVPEVDNYAWENAQTVTDFRKMVPVSVQVPEEIHMIFLKNVRKTLLNKELSIRELNNFRIEDPEAQKKYYRRFFERVLGAA
ncbi:hypothetical protein KBA73_04425 [Patescibacteria group bacterium]|nr:hypothetical protein [Patescibacteria group bacterium]